MDTQSDGAGLPYLDEVDEEAITRLAPDDPNLAAHDGDNDHEQFIGEAVDDDPLIF